MTTGLICCALADGPSADTALAEVDASADGFSVGFDAGAVAAGASVVPLWGTGVSAIFIDDASPSFLSELDMLNTVLMRVLWMGRQQSCAMNPARYEGFYVLMTPLHIYSDFNARTKLREVVERTRVGTLAPENPVLMRTQGSLHLKRLKLARAVGSRFRCTSIACMSG